jgi:hypothetical protein
LNFYRKLSKYNLQLLLVISQIRVDDFIFMLIIDRINLQIFFSMGIQINDYLLTHQHLFMFSSQDVIKSVQTGLEEKTQTQNFEVPASSRLQK